MPTAPTPSPLASMPTPSGMEAHATVSPDLEQQMDALLGQIDATTKQVANAMEDPPTTTQVDLEALQAALADIALSSETSHQPVPMIAQADESTLARAGTMGDDTQVDPSIPAPGIVDDMDDIFAAFEAEQVEARRAETQVHASALEDTDATLPADHSVASQDTASQDTASQDTPNQDIAGQETASPHNPTTPQAEQVLAEVTSAPEEPHAPEDEQPRAATNEPTVPAIEDQIPHDIAEPAQTMDMSQAGLIAHEPGVEAVSPADPDLASLDEQLADTASAMIAAETTTRPHLAPPQDATPAPQPEHEHQGVGANTSTAPSPQQTSAGARAAPTLSTLVRAASKAKGPAAWLWHKVEPKALQGVGLLGKPLENKPESARQATGLVGLYTLVVAGACWAWAVFLRPSHVDAAPVVPFDFQTSGLPKAEAAHDHNEHDGSASEQAKDGAAGGGHGEVKDAKGGKGKKPVLDGAGKPVINKAMDDRAKRASDAKKGAGKKAESKGGH